MDRRRRRLQDLERGREEFPVAEIRSNLARALNRASAREANSLAAERALSPAAAAGISGHAAISAGWL